MDYGSSSNVPISGSSGGPRLTQPAQNSSLSQSPHHLPSLPLTSHSSSSSHPHRHSHPPPHPPHHQHQRASSHPHPHSQPQRPPQPPPLHLRRPSSSSSGPKFAPNPHSQKDSKEMILTDEPASAIDLSKIRTFAACKSCRAKKIKCHPTPSVSGQVGTAPSEGGSSGSSNFPAPCQQCSQAGIECIYTPTRDRAAHSRQYVQNLESRVQLLESRYERMRPLLEAYEGGMLGTSLENLASVAGKRAKAIVATGNSHSEGKKPLSNGSEGLRRLGNVDRRHDMTDKAEELKQLPQRATLEGDGVTGSSRERIISNSSDLGETDDDEIETGQIAIDERGNYRWMGQSNTLTLLDSFGAAKPSSADSRSTNPRPTPDSAKPSSNVYFGPVAGSGTVKALPGVEEVTYPSREYSEKLVDAFFAELHPLLPVVYEYQFRPAFEELMDYIEKGDRTKHTAPFLSVVFAIFALGERVLVTSRAWAREKAKEADDDTETILEGEAEAGVIWFERSQILHYSGVQVLHIEQVQCLTLHAAFQASVNAMPMSWILAGQAIRVAQDIGLHRYTPRLPMSFADVQLGRRCWWTIYGLERMVSISLGRPLGVDDLDIDVPYPAEIGDDGVRAMGKILSSQAVVAEEPFDTTMSGFVALTKLCRIAGRVAHVLYRPSHGRWGGAGSSGQQGDAAWSAGQMSKLDTLLRDWLENEVPTKYKQPPPNSPVARMSAVLSNSYFAVLITLHRNLLPSNPAFPRPAAAAPPTSQSLTQCVEAARSVIHIASQTRILVPPSHHLAVFCQFLWSSAVILLLCEVRASDQVVLDAVEQQVESCRQSLKALEPVWPGSRKLKELLSDVEARGKEVRESTARTKVATARDGLGNEENHQVSSDSPHVKKRKFSEQDETGETGGTRRPQPGGGQPSHAKSSVLNALIGPPRPGASSAIPPATSSPHLYRSKSESISNNLSPPAVTAIGASTVAGSRFYSLPTSTTNTGGVNTGGDRTPSSPALGSHLRLSPRQYEISDLRDSDESIPADRGGGEHSGIMQRSLSSHQQNLQSAPGSNLTSKSISPRVKQHPNQPQTFRQNTSASSHGEAGPSIDLPAYPSQTLHSPRATLAPSLSSPHPAGTSGGFNSQSIHSGSFPPSEGLKYDLTSGPSGGGYVSGGPGGISEGFDFFDVGDMAFDGLELLQGFSGHPGAWWSTVTPEGIGGLVPPPLDGTIAVEPVGPGNGAGGYRSSSAPTPTAGPSPAGAAWFVPTVSGGCDNESAIHSHSLQQQIPGEITDYQMVSHQQQQRQQPTHLPHPHQQQHQQQSQGQTQGSPQSMQQIDLAQLWNQFTTGGFNWQADPNVPFGV